MVSRYHITLGAKTTAGGTVISASSFRSIEGATVAVEDDKIACPACRSIGVIKPHGPRLRETCDGKQVALEDDLCVCACPSPPRLIPNQNLSRQVIDGEAHAAEVAQKAASISPGVAEEVAGNEEAMPLLLVHPVTEEPFRYRPYRLELTGGRVIEGVTNEDGATRPLAVSERRALVAWQVSDESASS